MWSLLVEHSSDVQSSSLVALWFPTSAASENFNTAQRFLIAINSFPYERLQGLPPRPKMHGNPKIASTNEKKIHADLFSFLRARPSLQAPIISLGHFAFQVAPRTNPDMVMS